MSIFCKHQWKVLDKTIMPSKIEVLRKEGTFSISGSSFPMDLNKMTTQKTIITLTCEKCGKLKVITKTN
jgi:hypothetical protein